MAIPLDGRMTSFDPVPTPLTGTELMWMVQPGNAAQGILYNVTVDVIAVFAAAFPFLNTTIITAGATNVSPYLVATTDTRILFNKTLGSASFAVLPTASSMAFPFGILFKDLKGDAATNPITITFSGGQLCDGQSSVVIDNAFGWVTINPVPGGGAWFQT